MIPPYSDWEACLTCGTSSALDILLRIFCNRGDYVIMEQYTYSGAKDVIRAHGLQIMGVEMDELGLKPDELDRKMSEWDETLGKKPFLLYMIPTGHNPTGVTQPLERRKAIYEIAERHDLYIVEDDPYYYLQLGIPDKTVEDYHRETEHSFVDQYLAWLPPSYLKLDKSGRVVRLDSTAKIVAPGLRVGWLTASPQTVQKFLAYTELSTIAPSGPSQVIAFKILEESWGHKGLINWLIHLSNQYGRRRDTLIKACKEHLMGELFRWAIPSAGMFLWLQLDISKHPQIQAASSDKGKDIYAVMQLENRIYARAKEYGVLISKGSWFATELHRTTDLCFRLTFAAAAHNDLEEAIVRFGKAIEAEFKLESLGATP